EPPQRLAPYQAAKPEPKMPVTPEAATSATDNAFVDGAPKTVAANVGPDSTSDLKPDPATTSLPPATTMTSAAEKMPEQAAEQPVEKLAAGEGERAATADVRGMVHTSEQPGIVSPEGTPPTATREVAPTATTTVMSNTASAVAPTETVDVKKTPDAVEQAVAPVAPVASVATTDTTAVTPVAPVAREGSDVDTAPVMPSIQISVAPPPAPSTSLTPARPISEERGDAAADQNSNQDEGASSQADASDGLGYRPQIYGASNRDVRIVLRARAESWVQIQGAKNELLLTRMLRAGDSYRVPNRIDLVLMTGNAGAIEIIMDGVALGILGPIGQVRRNIKLNVDQLREQMQSTSRPSP
ncbi:MAG: DUF4115 domain-containing protein, partial [Rhodospirillaceae bacterium]|nr:DUF4115 domain-containing protein [Rhodospirillaceae bacterium]